MLCMSGRGKQRWWDARATFMMRHACTCSQRGGAQGLRWVSREERWVLGKEQQSPALSGSWRCLTWSRVCGRAPSGYRIPQITWSVRGSRMRFWAVANIKMDQSQWETTACWGCVRACPLRNELHPAWRKRRRHVSWVMTWSKDAAVMQLNGAEKMWTRGRHAAEVEQTCSKGEAGMQQKGSRHAAEREQTCRKGEAGMQQKGSRTGADMQIKCSRPVAEVKQRSSFTARRRQT